MRINYIFMNIAADTEIFPGSDFGPNDEVYCEEALRFYFNSSLDQVGIVDKPVLTLITISNIA